MDIRIQNPGRSKDEFMKIQKLHWQLIMKYNWKIIFMQLMIGLGFLYIGSINNEKGCFWNWEAGFGMSFLLLACIYSLQFIINRQKFISLALAEYHRTGNQLVEMIITDTSLTYKDSEKTYEFKWSAFTHYKLVQGHLFIIASGFRFPTFVISEKDTSNSQFTELMDQVKEKLNEKD